MKLPVFSLVLTLLSASVSSAACLYGNAVNSDGSRIDGSAYVSTSWNGKRAYPKRGNYELCLGSNPRKSITVYVDGRRYGSVYVDGDTRFDIRR